MATILRDIASRIRYAEATGERVEECWLCAEAWDEAVEALEPFVVLRGSEPLRYMGVPLVFNDAAPWIALKVAD